MDYQTQIQGFASRIELLPRNRQAFVFTVLAKSLLSILDEGNFPEARYRPSVTAAIDTASEFALGAQARDNRQLVEELQVAITHGDDIFTVEQFCVQCGVVVADTALRAASIGETVNGALVEYALAPLHSYLCEREFGVMDIGSSQSELAWEAQLPNDPKMSDALHFVAASIVGAEDGEAMSIEAIATISRDGRVLIPPG